VTNRLIAGERLIDLIPQGLEVRELLRCHEFFKYGDFCAYLGIVCVGINRFEAASSSQLVQPARLELALLDPQVGSKVRIIAANRLDEVLCMLSMDKGVDGVAEQRGRRKKV
jgi:hypothetical protein